MHQTTKQYLIPLLIGSLVAICGFLLVIVYTNPFVSGWQVHTAFYLTLFLSTSGIFTIINLLFRKRFFPSIYTELFKTSLRQGILIGLIIASLIGLEAINLLYWWVGATLILFFVALESFLSSN